MSKTFKTLMLTATLAAGALVLTGCGEETAIVAPQATDPQQDAQSTATLPPELIATTAPAEAQDVAALKQSAKQGETVTLRGKVGGSKEPLAANRAIMTVIDASLQTCDTMPGDTCATPWDACCEPADQIAAKSATVQVVDMDGRPLKVGLKGTGGIEPGKRVVVTGTVASASEGKTLIVNASQISVVPQ